MATCFFVYFVDCSLKDSSYDKREEAATAAEFAICPLKISDDTVTS